MNLLFANTSYFIALQIESGREHRTALAATSSFRGRVVTTSAVVNELGNYYSSISLRSAFEQFIKIIRIPQFEIIHVDSVLFQRGVEFYLKRMDKEWSLTDCISFVVMHDRGISEALTADHHFTQAGFNALLLGAA